jgi:hypothetical protein
VFSQIFQPKKFVKQDFMENFHVLGVKISSISTAKYAAIMKAA